MTQIEQIKAEIERLKECVGKASSDLCDFNDHMIGELSAYENIENFINSLSQEPQGLEEAAEEVNKRGLIGFEGSCWLTEEMPKDYFKAGAQWLAEQGVSVDGKVVMDFSDPADIINRRLIAKLGDALLHIEPCDVIVQIRKKED